MSNEAAISLHRPGYLDHLTKYSWTVSCLQHLQFFLLLANLKYTWWHTVTEAIPVSRQPCFSLAHTFFGACSLTLSYKGERTFQISEDLQNVLKCVDTGLRGHVLWILKGLIHCYTPLSMPELLWGNHNVNYPHKLGLFTATSNYFFIISFKVISVSQL